MKRSSKANSDVGYSNRKRNFSKRGGTRSLSVREVNSRVSLSAVGRFALSGRVSKIPPVIGMKLGNSPPLRFPRGVFLPLLLSFSLLSSAVVARSAKPAKTDRIVGVQTRKVSKASSTHMEKARIFRGKGKNDLAIAEFRKAIQIDPSLVEAALELGDLYFELGIFTQCAEILEPTLPLAAQQDFDPRTLGKAWRQLSRCRQEAGNLDRAVASLLKAVEPMPDDSESHKILADLEGSRGKNDQAFREYRQAGKCDPMNVAAWWAMGELALKIKRAMEASEALQGLGQADSTRAANFRKMMSNARLNPVDVSASPVATVADPYEGNTTPSALVSANAAQPLPTHGKPASANRSKPAKPQAQAPGKSPSSDDDPYADGEILPVPTPGKQITSPKVSPTISTSVSPTASETVLQTTSPGPGSQLNQKAAIQNLPVGSSSQSVQAAQAAQLVQAAQVAQSAPAASSTKVIPPAVVDDAVSRSLNEDAETAEKGRQDVLAIGAPAVPILAGKLSEPDPNTRKRTLELLGDFGKTAKPAFSSVEEALGDPDPGVVEAAQNAIDKIGSD